MSEPIRPIGTPRTTAPVERVRRVQPRRRDEEREGEDTQRHEDPAPAPPAPPRRDGDGLLDVTA